MLQHLKLFITSLVFFHLSNGFFFNQQQQQQQQQQPAEMDYQKTFLDNSACKDYLCPTTLKCVKSSFDCPCAYPDSQMKCLIQEKNTVVDTICISKPFISNNPVLQAKYDDINQGYKLKTPGVRDCGWAEEAFYGRV